MDVPDIPEDVSAADLDRDARARLRTLSKDNAEDVGRHLVMAGRMLEEDPELAYRHAQVALARGGRVDIVREAAAITAYATGRYAEALREFRTVTRLSGSNEHLALVADCERGLGRPEKALELASSPPAATLPRTAQVELQMVVAGARADMGQIDAGLLILENLIPTDDDQRARIEHARYALLEKAGRADEVEPPAPLVEEEPINEEDHVVVYDLEDDALDVEGDGDAEAHDNGDAALTADDTDDLSLTDADADGLTPVDETGDDIA